MSIYIYIYIHIERERDRPVWYTRCWFLDLPGPEVPLQAHGARGAEGAAQATPDLTDD